MPAFWSSPQRPQPTTGRHVYIVSFYGVKEVNHLTRQSLPQGKCIPIKQSGRVGRQAIKSGSHPQPQPWTFTTRQASPNPNPPPHKTVPIGQSSTSRAPHSTFHNLKPAINFPAASHHPEVSISTTATSQPLSRWTWQICLHAVAISPLAGAHAQGYGFQIWDPPKPEIVIEKHLAHVPRKDQKFSRQPSNIFQLHLESDVAFANYPTQMVRLTSFKASTHSFLHHQHDESNLRLMPFG